MIINPVKYRDRELGPHKSIIEPTFGTKTVLTNSIWEFVDLWLRKEKKDSSRFYWNQAREFHDASKGLPTQASPLLHYYSFMNAAKALLSSKGIRFDEHHGIRGHNISGISATLNIKNEGIKLLNRGIVSSMSAYFQEVEPSNIHSLQEIFFNLPYIHRTYCLTYPKQTEMFIPLKMAKFVVESGRVFFRAVLSKDFANVKVVNRLPPLFKLDSSDKGEYIITSKNSVNFSNILKPSKTDLDNLKLFNKQLRTELFYINGAETLWYLKSMVKGPKRISRVTPTLTLSAMHRLSEICRYKPVQLHTFLASQENWLLTEFINQSASQYFDEIASEVTGYQFLIPNIRTAS